MHFLDRSAAEGRAQFLLPGNKPCVKVAPLTPTVSVHTLLCLPAVHTAHCHPTGGIHPCRSCSTLFRVLSFYYMVQVFIKYHAPVYLMLFVGSLLASFPSELWASQSHPLLVNFSVSVKAFRTLQTSQVSLFFFLKLPSITVCIAITNK